MASGGAAWDYIYGTGKPQSNATRNVYVGFWEPSHNYSVGDIVTDNAGYSWICTANHNSNLSNHILPILPAQSNSFWTTSGSKSLDAISVINPNQSHTLSAYSDGTVPTESYIDSGTSLTVFEGTIKLEYDGTGTTAGTWRVETISTNITVGSLIDSGDYVTVGYHSGMAANINSASITYTIIGKRMNGDDFSIITNQSFSKSKAGTTAVIPPSYSIETDAAVIVKSAADAVSEGNYTPITIYGKMTDNAAYTTSYYGWITVTPNNGVEATTAIDVSTSPYVLTLPSNSNASSVTVKLYNQSVISGAVLLDSQTINVVFNGKNGEAYLLIIESTNGTEFRVGQSKTSTLKAHLFLNGVDVTEITPASWFRWRRVSVIPKEIPNDDETWNAAYNSGYKQIFINIDDVNSQASFFCDIVNPT
jgi:hypothetical protein